MSPLSLERASAANWHLIAELPTEAVIVAHFPRVEYVVLHLVKGQRPIDAPNAPDVTLRLGAQEAPLRTIVEQYVWSREIIERAFGDDTLRGFPLRIAVPDETIIVLPSGDTRRLQAIEVLISITRDQSDTAFDRTVYGDAGVAYASKTYMGAQVMFSMLQQDGQNSVAATIKAPDGKTASIVGVKTEWPGRPKT